MSNVNEPAIAVKNVSKKYRLFESARDRLKEALHPFSKRYHQEFWALQSVSFEVPRGQTIGILGRNGSGKSTLLQIIAGVMQPTSGEVIVSGRISALLELGAGFNPEFTGRENVVFQAQVMGLSDKEIERRLPEIEAFADIGNFFDQPVKTYSSGMFVRVAFAAAANVDPDILIVDEALSVGDAKFQHKCFQTFKRFLEDGKTLMIVSHDVGTLLRLCDSGIVLEAGRVDFYGRISKATNRYQELLFGKRARLVESESLDEPDDRMNEGQNPAALCDIPLVHEGIDDVCSLRPSYNKDETRLGDGRVRVIDYALVANGALEPSVIPFDAALSIYIKLYFEEDVENVSIGFGVMSKECIYVHGTNLQMKNQELLNGMCGEIIYLKLEWRAKLVGGDYFLNLGCQQISAQQDIYLDVRRSIAHLRLADTPWCSGFVASESTVEIIERGSSVQYKNGVCQA